jgi:DNA-binding transcriptional regulator YiaG
MATGKDMTSKTNNLRAAREATGLTRAAVARSLEIPYRTIEKWEAGDRNPPTYVKKMLLDYYSNRTKRFDT